MYIPNAGTPPAANTKLNAFQARLQWLFLWRCERYFIL